ncbi:hypothetical protein ABH932_004637 [Streptacidiphilus sp. MAP5-52]
MTPAPYFPSRDLYRDPAATADSPLTPSTTGASKPSLLTPETQQTASQAADRRVQP